ncbi:MULTISPECIES: daptide-type RiPP [Arthrobacter]|uniref:Daptide-type RiPP n=1 Tax=Arthrobacter methylotrophus TaxID=121291 RepID=A0ABV5UMC1_9MICC|nr:daptide-type RiPP [Arthrobacter sp. MA-N2]
MNSSGAPRLLDLEIQELESIEVPDDWSERIHGITVGLSLVGLGVAIT